MLERYIREVGISYLKSMQLDNYSSVKLQSVLESRFSKEFLFTMVHSIVFYHIKKESFHDFIANNRHELLPDKLSSMTHDHHSLLSYILTTAPKIKEDVNFITEKLITLLKEIKRDLNIDKNDYVLAGEINLNKGRLTQKSIKKLSKSAKITYKELATSISIRKNLIDFYIHNMGSLPVALYLLGTQTKNNEYIAKQIAAIKSITIKNMSGDKLLKPIIRPLFVEISKASGKKKLVESFDQETYTREKQDIYLTLINCF